MNQIRISKDYYLGHHLDYSLTLYTKISEIFERESTGEEAVIEMPDIRMSGSTQLNITCLVTSDSIADAHNIFDGLVEEALVVDDITPAWDIRLTTVQTSLPPV